MAKFDMSGMKGKKDNFIKKTNSAFGKKGSMKSAKASMMDKKSSKY